MRKSFRFNPLFAAIALAGIAAPALAERQQSVQSALVYVNGSGYFRYNGEDVVREAAHYPLILGSTRGFYQRSTLSPHPYVDIHTLNPATRITNYANGPHARNDSPEFLTASLNMIARWSNSRGQAGGTLWNTHGPCTTTDHWFLLKNGYTTTADPDCRAYLFPSYWESASNPMDGTPSVATYWLDFASTDVQAYWARATINDLLKKLDHWEDPAHPGDPLAENPLDPDAVGKVRDWKTDGLFIDTTSLTNPTDSYLPTKVYTKYDLAGGGDWNMDMASFIAAAVQAIHVEDATQDMYFNAGSSGNTAGATAWAYLDGLSATSRPTGLLEEDGFAVAYGPNEVQFWPELKWHQMVDTLRATSHMNAVFESHTEMLPVDGRDSGLDMVGNAIGYWDVYWFAMSSYLLGKNETAGNSYFAFYHKGKGPDDSVDALYLRYPDDNDLDIGKAVADYTSQNVATTGTSTIKIYLREYEKGWVFVNPTGTDSASFTLPEPGKPIGHDTFKNPIYIANTASLALPKHSGVVVLKDPVIGNWRLDETTGTTVSDAHEYLPGNTLYGAASGSPTWLSTGGEFGGALQFDGTDDYVAVAHDTARLAAPQQLTISYWAMPNSATTGSNTTVMQFGVEGQHGWRIRTGAGWNEFAFDAFSPSGTQDILKKPFQAAVSTSAWTHLAVTIENKAGGAVKTYRNGQLLASDTLAQALNLDAADTLYIGKGVTGSGSTFWGGKLDNVKIESRVLSPYEVAAEYRGQVGDWRLDEPKYRRRAFDTYGSAHAVATGDPTWLGTGTGSGVPLGAIQLDGYDDTLSITDNVAQLATPAQFTLNLWVQPASDSSSDVVAMYGVPGVDGWMLQAGTAANDVALTVFDGGSYDTYAANASTSIALSSSTWTKLTVTVDNKVGGAVKIYVNGATVPLTQSVLTAPFSLTNSDGFYLGQSVISTWKGKLGHVQLFSRILSPSEIAQLTN